MVLVRRGYVCGMTTSHPDPDVPHRDLAGHELPDRIAGDEGLGAGDPESLAPHEKAAGDLDGDLDGDDAANADED
jgi:hypothetical protein